MTDREKEFKELHKNLLIQAGLEFKKHGFAPTPLQIKYDFVMDIPTEKILNV